jgi:lysophospholipase L1-like esterase
MRVAVLGNSDTTGQKLQPGATSWPILLGERLSEAAGVAVEIDSWKFAAYRPDAVSYALELVDGAEPDVVIVTLASYWCAFSTVQAGVEQRFGIGAGQLVQRAERKLGPAGRRGVTRRVARKVAGTGTLLSVEQFIEVFSSLIRELAKRESLQVLVMEDHHFTPRLRKKMPTIDAALPAIVEAIEPLVAERRMHWSRVEDAISAGGRRDEMILEDDVHMTPEAHGRMAAALTELVLPLLPQRTAAGSFASSAKPS